MAEINMQEIYFWDDGTWIPKNEYTEEGYAWKRKSHGVLEVKSGTSDADINAQVLNAIG